MNEVFDFTNEEMQIINDYCDNDMAKIKRITYPIIKKIGGLDGRHYDDVYSYVQFLLLKTIKDRKYDSDKSAFDTYFIGIVKRRIRDEFIRDRNRMKRMNIISNSETGENCIVQDISLDEYLSENNENDNKHHHEISDGNTVEQEIFGENSERLDLYMSKLSIRQRKIAELISFYGYSLNEAREYLNIDVAKFNDDLFGMRSYRKAKYLMRY